MTRYNPPYDRGRSVREQLLLSLLNEAGDSEGRLLGRMKLMKLVFFLEHWESDQDNLVPDEQVEGFDDFKIYKYGPFSEELLHTFDYLKNSRLITEQEQMYGPTRIQLTEEGQEKASQGLEDLNLRQQFQLDKVVNQFGDMDGNELEEQSLEYLGIDRDEKKELQGTPVESVIRPTSV